MHKHIICIKIHKVLYSISAFIFVQEVFTKMLQGTFCNTSFLCKTAISSSPLPSSSCFSCIHFSVCFDKQKSHLFCFPLLLSSWSIIAFTSYIHTLSNLQLTKWRILVTLAVISFQNTSFKKSKTRTWINISCAN